MLQTNQDWLTFDPKGVPPSKDEIDSYIQTLRPQSKAAKRKANIFLGLTLLSFFSVFGFIFSSGFTDWVSVGPQKGTSALDSFGSIIVCAGILSGYFLYFTHNCFHKSQLATERTIENSEAASLDLLEELLEMVTNTGIRPDYLYRVADQKRELTVSEVLDLKAHISKEHAARRRAEIQSAFGVPTIQDGSPSDNTDTNNGPIQT